MPYRELKIKPTPPPEQANALACAYAKITQGSNSRRERAALTEWLQRLPMETLGELLARSWGIAGSTQAGCAGGQR
jgi:hypothetical protein